MESKTQVTPYRKTALITGILFLVGTVAGISSGLVTQPLLSGADYLTNILANESRWVLGALLVLVMGLPLAMVPVVLFPVLKKRNEVLAIGAVIFRGVLEAVSYILFAVSMLLLLAVARPSAGLGASDAAVHQALGDLLLSAGDWIELILAIVFSIGSMMISLLLFQMNIIPRWLSGWGLAGSVLYFAVPFVSMFSDPHLALSLDTWPGFLMAPLALQEMVFALWMIVKGFNPSPEIARSVL